MHHLLIVIVTSLATVLSYPSVYAQKNGIYLLQGDTVALKDSGKGYHEAAIKAMPFTLSFRGDQLHACASPREKLFEYTKTGTDINKDHDSYFFIYKYGAMAEDADFLTTEETANSLNPTHGAVDDGNGRYHYTVRSLLEGDGKMISLKKYKHLFLALWSDTNKDDVIGEDELLKVKLSLR